MHRGSHRGGDDSSTIALLFGNGGHDQETDKPVCRKNE
jgi:hypothetical protein